ncbi:MAG: hypothetical protein CVU79_10360 [Elusimicrobia bacterium HGW-Elusimicrobia-3]|nr:MAG: hypothetical protein CVU79_10360 [Elusimicrobia bacterium HGW-Elusimicrobia-3]
MKKLLLIPLLLSLAAGPAPAKDKPMEKTAEKISDFASFKAPEGWTQRDFVEQGDPQIRLERGLHAITVRLAGGTASRYKNASAFLAGFEARSMGGKPAEKLANAVVSGSRALVYRRKVPLDLPPPDESGPAEMGTEQFCLVPAGKRFFVLSYSYGDSVPDPSYDGEKAWRAFLKGFKAKKR